jgi:hypothetical protein
MATRPATSLRSPGMSRRSIGRSALAILGGILTNAVPALLIDQVLHMTAVYPPWGQPMFEPELNLLAFSYRLVFAVLGGYVTARLAPFAPIRHTVILGVIGIVLAGLGAIASMSMNIGPGWYPLALVVIALPASWLGGRLRAAQN